MAQVCLSTVWTKARSIAALAGALTLVLAAPVGALAAPSSTAAPDKATERRWRLACTHDAFVFCTFQALSGSRVGVRNCLIHNIERISPLCRGVFQAGRPAGPPPPPPPPPN